ncbi:MAG: PAS domain-containing protein [Bacteroidetes bacterium]|nr:PAS domain-containing protein [Fibrella sp.]
MAIGVLKGREMIIEIGNDRLFEVWGKSKSITGMRLIEALPELKGQVFIGLLEAVYDTGEPFFGNGVLAMLERRGVLEETYFDFAYTPLRDETGVVSGVMVMATNVTSQVLARREVEEAEANLRGAIALADLGTWELDVAAGTVTYSDRIKSWFGFSGDTVPLSIVYNPIHEKDRSRVEAAIAAALQPGSAGIYDEEYTLVDRHTGYERIIHAQGRTFFDAQGKPVKITGTAQDVTEQRETRLALEQLVKMRTEELAATNEELAVINEELTESNKLLFRSNENLQQFAYIASHDLQEPLRKIQSFGDLLKKQYATALGDGVGHLDRMQSAASRMSMLIKDLLAFSRISTQPDASGAVSLNQVVNMVLADLDLTVQETGANVVISPLPIVQGDPSQLGQLFQNLLSNALKFRRWDEAGVPVVPQIRVHTRLVAAADLPPSVRPTRGAAAYHHIEVSDNGIGFDEKYVDRIFQVFQRLHGRSEFAGTGIGLAICAKVVANHGGAITAHSEPGQGATFSVYLPG